VVYEANLTGGLGGEIVARATESLFGSLRAPILRVATPDVPMPAAPTLQAAALPDVAKVVSTVRGLLERNERSL
jgi:acetoin:2,6-dichlorophenolindophenol oxidoreductase subunit beta